MTDKNNTDAVITQNSLHEELLRRYSRPNYLSTRNAFRLFFKRFAWLLVVRGTYFVKRCSDIAGSFCLLLCLTPLFMVVAIAIKIESSGPVMFRQTRVGRWGKLFTMWKFRSMYMDAEERKKELEGQNEMAGGTLFKMKSDPRITRVGKFIRKASIDELPQLWNVLTGDMSLVGPRPALPSEVNTYLLEERRRLDAIPGITCIWQVSGRSEIPFEQQVHLDIDYIESQSLLLDLGLLLKTIPAVFMGKGAY